jgi:hypothetical protein
MSNCDVNYLTKDVYTHTHTHTQSEVNEARISSQVLHHLSKALSLDIFYSRSQQTFYYKGLESKHFRFYRWHVSPSQIFFSLSKTALRFSKYKNKSWGWICPTSSYSATPVLEDRMCITSCIPFCDGQWATMTMAKSAIYTNGGRSKN